MKIEEKISKFKDYSIESFDHKTHINSMKNKTTLTVSNRKNRKKKIKIWTENQKLLFILLTLNLFQPNMLQQKHKENKGIRVFPWRICKILYLKQKNQSRKTKFLV